MSIFNTKKYVLGISGGPDSMALLYFYRAFIKVACIVNYNKREDSNEDVELVKDMCKKYKVKLEILEIDKEYYSQNKIKNFQSWARKIRYDFFEEMAKKYNASKILLAHHVDDFVETAYMQQAKKSKALFYGIMKKSKWNDLEIYRPFINWFRKDTIQRMCDQYKIPYRIDSSNNSDEYERNRIRKLIASWPEQKYYDFLYDIKKYNKKHNKQRKQNIKIFAKFTKLEYSFEFFKKLTEEQKYYLIYNFLSTNNISTKSYSKISNVISFLNSESQKCYRVEQYWYIKIRKHKIVLFNTEQEVQDVVEE